ncbi:hypothetical protein [Gynuella sunshinyii]|uniref:hypothetical protein n=1 Tax=Gynuella sunshinyii TaxID=1445505 RepID=UPI001184EC0B|nr:hypothetical protein [Gynuella sunshinyii]
MHKIPGAVAAFVPFEVNTGTVVEGFEHFFDAGTYGGGGGAIILLSLVDEGLVDDGEVLGGDAVDVFTQVHHQHFHGQFALLVLFHQWGEFAGVGALAHDIEHLAEQLLLVGFEGIGETSS